MGMSFPVFQKSISLRARRDAVSSGLVETQQGENCANQMMPDLGFDHSDIGSALSRIVSHHSMKKSPKLRAFLEFVVSETLAGRGDRLKAYSIAVTALGKSAAFDPVSDPIVRVEASRLRRYLKSYYESEGQSDPVRITLPTGSYQPVFERLNLPSASKGFAESQESPIFTLRAVSSPKHADSVIVSDRHTKPNLMQSFGSQFQRAFMVANTVLMIFVIALGLKVLIEIENITGHIERFQKYWDQHLTAKVE